MSLIYDIFFILYAALRIQNILVTAVPIRGENVEIAGDTEYLFTVSIGEKVGIPHFCGGSLITRTHVLTAEHCLRDKLPDDIQVSIGSANYHLGRKYNVRNWVIYNDWAWALCYKMEYHEMGDNDVAIIILDKSVTNENIEPVALSKVEIKELYDIDAVVMGWGYTNNNELPIILRKGNVKVLKNEACSQTWSFASQSKKVLTENYICSSAVPHLFLNCGDSGGPIVDKNNILLGIHKGNCPSIAEIAIPISIVGMFTFGKHSSVYYYRDFIKAIAEVQNILVTAVPIRGEKVQVAGLTEFLFAVSIGEKLGRPHFCGGSLITSNHVLTAEHCLRNKVPEKIQVSIGSANYQLGKKYNVKSWVMYNEWASASCYKDLGENDIAIMELGNFVEDVHIQPITLSKVEIKELHGIDAVIMGWGYTNHNILPVVLRKGDVKVLSNDVCSQTWSSATKKEEVVGENYICSSAEPFLLLNCGDSGGPIVDKNNNLLGVHKGNCPDIAEIAIPISDIAKYAFGRHSSVYYYRDFIKAIAGV